MKFKSGDIVIYHFSGAAGIFQYELELKCVEYAQNGMIYWTARETKNHLFDKHKSYPERNMTLKIIKDSPLMQALEEK
jgi:hypothetical protein